MDRNAYYNYYEGFINEGYSEYEAHEKACECAVAEEGAAEFIKIFILIVLFVVCIVSALSAGAVNGIFRCAGNYRKIKQNAGDRVEICNRLKYLDWCQRMNTKETTDSYSFVHRMVRCTAGIGFLAGNKITEKIIFLFLRLKEKNACGKNHS